MAGRLPLPPPIADCEALMRLLKPPPILASPALERIRFACPPAMVPNVTLSSMIFGSIGSPFGKCDMENAEELAQHQRHFDRMLQLAERFGTPIIRGFALWKPKETGPEIGARARGESGRSSGVLVKVRSCQRQSST